MSMHKTPLTDLEREGLEKHHLPVGTPSQLADSFRHGVAWALSKDEHPDTAAINCAEEWLEHFSAKHDLKVTHFECIGDMIKYVCEQLELKLEAENRAARVQNAKLMAVTEAPGGFEKLVEVLRQAKELYVSEERENCAELCDAHFEERAAGGLPREAAAARALAKKIRARNVNPFQPTATHINTGKDYQIVGTATLQTGSPLEDMDSMVVYRGADGRLWVRELEEFESRFKVAPK